MTHYDVKMLADNISPDGVRLMTIQCIYPRFIHAEVKRHRVQSCSAMSSRAVPPEKLIERVRIDPFVPETLGARVKGMGYGRGLDPEVLERALEVWRAASRSAADYAEALNDLGVDKSRVNRLLEPFLPIADIITATEWDNFFALRQPMNDEPVPQSDFPAQPEFQIFARMARDVINASTPRQIDYGEWHLPLVDDDEMLEGTPAGFGSRQNYEQVWAKISAGRVAPVSFARTDVSEDTDDTLMRYVRLTGDAHWSPAEHPARPMSLDDLNDEGPLLDKIMVTARAHREQWLDVSQSWCGNFRGWVQLRKLYSLEHNRMEWMREQDQ